MNYYVLDTNQEIALFDTIKSRLQTTLKFMPELADEKIHQTTKEIIELDGKFVFADEHESELLEKAKAEKIVELRAKRDAELDATDFYLMPDYPISGSDLTLIQKYRQELRDLPQQEDFPYVDFPVNPLTSKVEE